MRNLALIAAVGAVLVVLIAVIGFRLLDGQGASAGEVPGGVPLNMMIDPETTGNTCAASPTDCDLGTVEECVRVNVSDGDIGDTTADFEIDLVIDDPAGDAEAPSLYQVYVTYELSEVIPKTANQKNLRMPGANMSGWEALPEPSPDGELFTGYMFLACEPMPGHADDIDCENGSQGATWIGDGPVARIGLAVQSGAGCDAASGGCVADFDLHDCYYFSLGGYQWPDWVSNDLTCYGAKVAINTDCPGAPPYADVEILSQEVRASDCTSDPPSSIDVGADTVLCLRKSIVNNGPESPVDVDITTTSSQVGGSDCTITPDGGNPTSYSDLTSTPVTVDEKFTINCTNASDHSFNFVNDIVLSSAGSDPDTGNNSMTTPYSNTVLAEADLQVTSVVVDAPSQWGVNGAFDVTVDANVTNDGPYSPVNADVTLDLDLTSAPDCSKVPDTPQTDQDLSLGTDMGSATWSVTCTSLGSKTFSGTASAALDHAHVSDPNPSNNAGGPTTDSTDITDSADVAVVTWSVVEDDLPNGGNQVVIVPPTAETIHTNQVIHNIGPDNAPVVVDDRSVADVSGVCDVEPNLYSGSFNLVVSVNEPQDDTWTVTWIDAEKPPYFCTLSFQKQLTIPPDGVLDPVPGNNSATVLVHVVLDSDGDGVPDDGDLSGSDSDARCDTGQTTFCDDNCGDVANNSGSDIQNDFDDDSLGDACDDDDDDDGHTDDVETTLGSDPLNSQSTPEHIDLPWTCTDGIDNDLDGLPDLFDCDTDGDGIANYFDACPFTTEDMDGHQDDDGCPDTDNDMDGVCDPWAAPSQPACTGSDGCPNVAEDIDSFHDTDGCPDPDNDGDGFPDSTDFCPGTDWTAGPDGIPDNGDEPLTETEPPVPMQTKEDYDGVIDWDGCHDSPGDDWDSDGITDEDEVFLHGSDPTDMDTDNDGLCDGHKLPLCASEDANNNGIVDPGETDPTDPDTDGDGLSDGLESGLAVPETPDTDTSSLNWQPDADPGSTTDPLSSDTDGDGIDDGAEDPNHNGAVDPGETAPGDDDTDGDVFLDGVELYLDTDPLDACPDNPTHDAWPLDMNMDTLINLGSDVIKYVGNMGGEVSVDPSLKRLDLNGDGNINLGGDVIKYVGKMGASCT